jgi:hypothetical protein
MISSILDSVLIFSFKKNRVGTVHEFETDTDPNRPDPDRHAGDPDPDPDQAK